jgi:hypothetical protein
VIDATGPAVSDQYRIRAERRFRIRLVMGLGEGGGTQNVRIWERETLG